MILVLNCMEDERFVKSFDEAILRLVEASGKKAEFVRVPKIAKIPSLSGYSHIIVSGSEASAVEDNIWDGMLAEAINEIVRLKKPLLGICYGHQFLTRAISGKACVRKSLTPEFGWGEIRLTKAGERSDLFKGIIEPYCMLSHYDEVCNLPIEYKVLAYTSRCEVHAYRYKNLPVWGVQFHPEYGIRESDEIFDVVKEEDPALPGYFFSMKEGKLPGISQNERIIGNFLSV